MAGVTFDNVTKVYGDGYPAVSDLDLDVHDGEFVVLVGPSGCGKTTALRMLAGLEEVSGGEIRIGERVVNDLPPRDRDIAMVFQNYALYPHMTVAENIGFALADAEGAEGGGAPADRGDRPHPRSRRAPRPQAAPAVGRPAAARCHGPRDRPRAAGLPHGRAAVEPRREAARSDASRDRPLQRQLARHDVVRHPRSGRGDDHGRSRRGHAQGAAPAVRRAAARSTSGRATCSSRASSAARR